MKDFEQIITSSEMEPLLSGKMETDESIWKSLREIVEDNYRQHKVSEELIRQFTLHNLQVEDFVNEFSEKEKFNDKEKEIAILCAILHDATKGYGEFSEHGKEGGKFAKVTLMQKGISEGLAESVRLGIERHMGQEGYPAEIAKAKYGEDFRYPAPRTKVGELVYKCDILTQLTSEGFDKILLLRKNDPENIREDMEVALEKGISVEEARLLSALRSAGKSYTLIMKPGVHELDSLREFARAHYEELQAKYADLIALMDSK